MWKYREDNLLKIVNDSNSITEVMSKLGLFNCNSNRRTVKKYIKKYDINCEHFVRGSYLKRETYEKRDIYDIMVVDSSYSTGHLKDRLYREGLKDRMCEMCGQDENWKGKKMSLILDHINGINNDHRFDNLRIVCPNCNSTLDTFAGKNSKKTRCINSCLCGEEISYGAKKCDKCYRIASRKVDRPDLDELIKMIDDVGYVGVGKIYNVTDNAVRKWVKNYKGL